MNNYLNFDRISSEGILFFQFVDSIVPAGICGGIISVTSFAALVAIYPERVATVTALAETVLNGALAVGPFMGSVLYAVGGFQLVTLHFLCIFQTV